MHTWVSTPHFPPRCPKDIRFIQRNSIKFGSNGLPAATGTRIDARLRLYKPLSSAGLGCVSYYVEASVPWMSSHIIASCAHMMLKCCVICRRLWQTLVPCFLDLCLPISNYVLSPGIHGPLRGAKKAHAVDILAFGDSLTDGVHSLKD